MFIRKSDAGNDVIGAYVCMSFFLHDTRWIYKPGEDGQHQSLKFWDLVETSDDWTISDRRLNRRDNSSKNHISF